MVSKARKAATNKQAGASAADRALLEQAEREDAEGQAPRAAKPGSAAAGPADFIREQKAKIEEANKVEPPPMPKGRHPASDAAEEAGRARRAIGDLVVPMTLSEVAEVMGAECSPDTFPVSSIEALASQLGAVSQMADVGGQGGYERWQVVDNIVARMKLASRVTGWMLTGGEAQS